MKRFNVILIIGIIFSYFVFGIFYTFAEQQKRYVPYPILFVSGIGTATSGSHFPAYTWRYLISEYLTYYNKYVIEEMIGNYDLSYGEEVYLEFLAYDGNQSIETNASVLKAEINRILTKYYPSDYTYVAPCETPKVILVTHSMGGLIARKMLQKYGTEMKDKVAQIFFLGTPHLGSPLANIISFLPEENEELLKRIEGLDKIIKKRIKGDKSEAVSLRNKLKSKLKGNANAINVIKERMNVVADGNAIIEMRIPSTNANSYSHYFVSANRILGWNLPLNYTAETTFLANLGTADPGVPNTSIAGTDVYLKDIIYDLFRYAPKFGALGYTFEPNDYSCVKNGYYNDGDGVVNRASQTAVGASSVFVSAAHSSTLSDQHVGEYDSSAARDIILQAIEDEPEIESVRAVPEDWNKTYVQPTNDSNSWYYLIFKLKDYLLADIEIESLTLDGVDISGGMVKPYNTIGKAFLKERDCNGVDSPNELAKYKDIYNNEKYLPLMPGEFYIKTKIPYDAQTLYIKVKNPAAQYDSTKFSAEKTLTIARPKVTTVDFTPHNRRLMPPWELHAIDVPPYDESYVGNNGEPTPDSLPNEVKLSFKIEESPAQQVEVNAWLYSYPWFGSDMVWKRFSTARPVTLESAGLVYNKYFDPILEPFTTWNGDRDGSGYVPPWPDELPSGVGPRYYEVKITTQPDDNPLDDKLYLLGSNWDDPDHDKTWLYINGQWQENINNDIIIADPTFIQASRREGVSW